MNIAGLYRAMDEALPEQVNLEEKAGRLYFCLYRFHEWPDYTLFWIPIDFIVCQHIIVGVCQHDLGVKSYRWKIRFFLIRPVVIVQSKFQIKNQIEMNELTKKMQEIMVPKAALIAYEYRESAYATGKNYLEAFVPSTRRQNGSGHSGHK